MRGGWRPDPGIDAIHARAAVEIDVAEQLPVGPLLVNALVRLQGRSMDCTTAARATTLWDRLTAWTQAQAMIPCTEALHGTDLPDTFNDEDAAQIVAQDLAVMAHVSFGSAMERVTLVKRVGTHLPLAWEALARGELLLAHVTALTKATRSCTPRVARAVDERVVPEAIARGWTPTELRNAARRAVLSIDPDGEADRAELAKECADVQLFAEDHETAVLVANGDAAGLRQVMDAIDQRAAELGRAGDIRAIGQRRLAALADYVLGSDASAHPKVETIVTIDLTTLLGLTHRPGELSGYGPISAETAREMTKDATLRRLITDPIAGTMIDLGRTRYRPSRALRRIIDARDRTCRFPGCTRRAIDCDADHARRWPDGATTTDNLHTLCRMHHNLKTRQLWKVELNPDGTESWTSYLGRRYTTPAATYPIELLDPPVDEPPDDQRDTMRDSDPDPPAEEFPLPTPPPLTNDELEEFDYALDHQQFVAFAEGTYDDWLRLGLVG